MRRLVPVLTLFVLSPFVAEVLFGATPLSNLGALFVVLPLYGGGAVLVREIGAPAWPRLVADFPPGCSLWDHRRGIDHSIHI